MAATAAKLTIVKVSPDNVTYTTVAQINDAGPSISGDNQDVTVFSEQWMDRIQGLKDGSWSISGFYDASDTLGQVAILNALINDTVLWIEIFPGGGTAGFKQRVKVASFDISDAVDGVCELSVDFDGAGTLSLLP